MKRLKRRSKSRSGLFFCVLMLAFCVFWTIAWWKQSDASLVRDDNNQWHQVTDGEKTAKKALGLCGGVVFLAVLITFIKHEFTSAYALEVEREEFDFSCELASDQVVGIEPLHGLSGNALSLSLHYECDWEPRLKNFKMYRHAPKLTYVSYHAQIFNDQAYLVSDKTFTHEEYGGDGAKPYWKEELLPVSTFSENYTLRLRPIFDVESLKHFDKNASDKRLTIQLQIKLAVYVSPNHRRRAELSQVSLSQARAIVHRVLDL